jgi:nucleoid DNA-binding protein
MTKSELVAQIAQQAGIPKKAATVALDTIVSAVHDVLKKGDRIRIADLGSFSIATQTKAPRFTPAKALRDVVRK